MLKCALAKERSGLTLTEVTDTIAPPKADIPFSRIISAKSRCNCLPTFCCLVLSPSILFYFNYEVILFAFLNKNIFVIQKVIFINRLFSRLAFVFINAYSTCLNHLTTFAFRWENCCFNSKKINYIAWKIILLVDLSGRGLA